MPLDMTVTVLDKEPVFFPIYSTNSERRAMNDRRFGQFLEKKNGCIKLFNHKPNAHVGNSKLM